MGIYNMIWILKTKQKKDAQIAALAHFRTINIGAQMERESITLKNKLLIFFPMHLI